MAHRREMMTLVFQVWEGVIILIALGVAVVFSHSPYQWASLGKLVESFSIVLLVSTVVVWHVLLRANGLYRSRRLKPVSDEYLRVLWSVLLITGHVSAVGLLLEIDFVNGQLVWIFLLTTSLLALSSRLLVRWLLRRIRTLNRNIRSVVIVGSGPRGLRLVEMIDSHPELGYRILGFVDQSSDDRPVPDALSGNAYPLLGELADLPDILSHNPVDDVFVALPIKSNYNEIQKVLFECEVQGIDVNMLTDFFDLDHLKRRVVQIGTTPAIEMYRGPDADWRFQVKRLIDFFGSSILLVVLAPVFLAVGVGVKLTSPGPVFFIQDRVGLNKRTFRMWKFRTMVANAESLRLQMEGANDLSGPAFKIKNDPRVTRFGAFLRRTSLDELPQLINVWFGDMSLVGPRPLPLPDAEGFEEDWQRRRFRFPPGLTCTWQISGRSEISFEQWMQMDLDYIDKWSLLNDLRILLRTIPAVLKGKGAY